MIAKDRLFQMNPAPTSLRLFIVCIPPTSADLLRRAKSARAVRGSSSMHAFPAVSQ